MKRHLSQGRPRFSSNGRAGSIGPAPMRPVAFCDGFKLPDILTTGGKMDLKVSLPLRIVLTGEVFPEMGSPALTAH